MKYDVVIGGGGPAGAVSAYLLAKKGLNVLLVDKETFPRYKPCGGGIPLKTNKLFPFDISPTYELQADGAIINYQGSVFIKMKFDLPYGWLVMRDTLDQFLVEQAKSAGAQVMENTTIVSVVEDLQQVEIQTNHGTMTSQYLIGADGVNSLIARNAGLLTHRQTGAAIEAELIVPASAMESQGHLISFDFGAIPGGYGWIFPKKDHFSVGIFQANNRKTPGFRNKLSYFISKNPLLKNSYPSLIRGHLIPLGGSKQPLNTKRIILVGDAANLADSWLGEGIYYAVKSACIASDSIYYNFIHPDSSLSTYSARIHQEISRQLDYARKISNFVYHFPQIASCMVARSDLMQKIICSTVYGKTTNEQLFKTMIQHSPRIIFQTIRNNP